MKGKIKAEKNVSDFSISLPKTPLWLARTRRKKQVKKIMRVLFDPVFDEKEPRWYVKIVEDCERILMEKEEDVLGKNGFRKDSLRKVSNSSVFGSALHKKSF